MKFLTTNLVSLPATVLTASNINSNFPASNLQNMLRSKRVRTSTGTTTLELVIDIGTTEDVDSVIMMWPKEDGIRLTDDATVKIQANATDVWTAPAVNQTLTIDNDYSVASHFFSTDQSYRYWRISIEDATNPYEYIELGMCWIGKALEVDNASNGFKWKDMDRSNSISNEFGHKYIDEYPITSALEFQFENLTYAQIETLVQAYRLNGSSKPVIVALDQTEVVFDKDHFLIYGTMSKQFGLTHVHYNILTTDSIIVEELS